MLFQSDTISWPLFWKTFTVQNKSVYMLLKQHFSRNK